MKNKQAAAALRELMGVYNDLRAKWITEYGSDEGFSSWFWNQVTGRDEK